MKSQKKCQNCGKWTDGARTHCTFCDSTIDPHLLAKEQRKRRDAKAREQRLAEETRFEKYLRSIEESDKIHHKILFGIGKAIFNLYMAILSFFIWLVAIASG